MINLIPIPILKSDINNNLISIGQLIYCTDTLEAFCDIDSKSRVALNTTRQITTEAQRTILKDPNTQVIYIVIESNKLYRYSQASGWVAIRYIEECTDLIYNASNLDPGTMYSADGIARAPMTLASQVFNNDGSTVEDTINSLLNSGKKISLEKRVAHVILEYDNQRIVDIPYPTSEYDIYKYPTMVVLEDTYILPNKYALGSEQLIFNDEVSSTTKKGQIVTFIFAYCNINMDEGVDADSIDGRGFSIGDKPPLNPTDKHMWIDTGHKKIKEWHADLQKWDIVFDNNAATAEWIENTVILTDATTFVDIGIDGYNKNVDKLEVHLNSTHLIEGVNFTISADSKTISTKDGEIWTIFNGDPNYFHFYVLKNVPSYTGSGVVIVDDESEKITNIQSRIIVEKLSTLEGLLEGLVNKVNAMDKQTDISAI